MSTPSAGNPISDQSEGEAEQGKAEDDQVGCCRVERGGFDSVRSVQ